VPKLDIFGLKCEFDSIQRAVFARHHAGYGRKQAKHYTIRRLARFPVDLMPRTYTPDITISSLFIILTLVMGLILDWLFCRGAAIDCVHDGGRRYL